MKSYLAVIIFLFTVNISLSQWIFQNTPDNIGLLLTLDFADPQNGYGGGYIYQNDFYGRALYTTNAGTNWILAQVPDSSRVLVAMQFFNSSTGYSAGACNTFFMDKNKVREFSENKFDKLTGQQKFDHSTSMSSESGENVRGLFYKSTDGGKIWNTFGQLPGNVYYLTGLYFINSNTGYVTSSYSVFGGVDDGVLKTTDGGSSWNILTLPDTVNSLRNIFFTDSNTGFSVGFNRYTDTSDIGVIIKTTNAGNSWQIQTLSDVNSFSDIYFTDSNTGFVIGGKGGIFSQSISVVYKTTNAGTNWQVLPVQFPNVILQGVRFVKGTGTGIIYGATYFTNAINVFTSRTTNYGQTWINNTIDSNGILAASKLIDQNNWYLGGGNSFHATVMHSTNGGVSVNNVSTIIPRKFNLYQNYPNPFNPVTKIKFDVTQDGSVGTQDIKLVIYDAAGKEISTLVNGKLSAGTYEVDFEGKDYSSGIYFYQLTTNEYTETKRMTLLK